MTEGSPSGGHFQMASKIEARGVAPRVAQGVAPRCPCLSAGPGREHLREVKKSRLERETEAGSKRVAGGVVASTPSLKYSLSRHRRTSGSLRVSLARFARRRLGCARVVGADFVWALESPALCSKPEKNSRDASVARAA